MFIQINRDTDLSTCVTQKVVYLSPEAARADRDAIRISYRNRKAPSALRHQVPYRCRYCGRWHLATKRKFR